MKYLTIFLIILISFHFYSCDDNENDFNFINPSISLIEMEDEGGEIEISFTYPDWKIARIINQNGNVNIFGNSYYLNSSLIRENSVLKLDSLGRLDAIWTNKGFSIIRNSYTSLKILVKENSTGEDFNFVVILESNNESKKIIVNQKKSQGYSFKKIEYKLHENDGDSIFTKQDKSFSFNVKSSIEFSFLPINGIKSSFFESVEKDAFVWTESDSVLVKIPSTIWNRKLYFSEQEHIYTNTLIKNESEYCKKMGIVTIPSGISEFSVEVEYRKRKISYSLYLVNNRTKKEKVINGKWVESAPTGNYKIKWKN